MEYNHNQDQYPDEDDITLQELESDSNSDSSTIMNQEIPTISEDVLFDIEEDIMTEIDDYVRSNIETYSSPDFHENVILHVADHIYSATVQSHMCDQTEANRFEILMVVKDLTNKLFYEANIFPPRSYPPNTDLNNISTGFNSEESIKNQLRYLKSLPQPPQRTQEWYDLRNNLITASNIYKAFGSESQQNSLIYEKCRPQTQQDEYSTVNGARGWGQKYETVTSLIYADMNLESVLDTDFGCICHSKHPFLGASPDGIFVYGPRIGHLVEIKNTVSREITDTPIESHWIQCQLQMEVCDLPYCDYVQTAIKEITWEEFQVEQYAEYKGVILQVLDLDLAQGYKYFYMPLQYLTSTTDPNHYDIIIESWKSDVLQQFSNQNILKNTLYWKLEEISCVVIPRNKEWFESVLPKISEIWNKIEEARSTPEGYKKYAPKRRAPTGPQMELIRSFFVSLLPGEEKVEENELLES